MNFVGAVLLLDKMNMIFGFYDKFCVNMMYHIMIWRKFVFFEFFSEIMVLVGMNPPSTLIEK